MPKKRTILLMLGLFLGLTTTSAQKYSYGVQHALRANIDAAYMWNSALGPAQPAFEVAPITSSYGVASGIGVGYRLKKNHFLFDAGIAFRYGYTADGLEDETSTHSDIDTDGDSYIAHEYWRQRQNALHRINCGFPIQFGGEWNRVYFLLGARVGVNLFATSTEHNLYTKTGEYEWYIDEFASMPNHTFVTDEPQSRERVTYGYTMDIRACAEVGYRLNHRNLKALKTQHPKPDWYIAAFGEYSVFRTAPYAQALVGVRATMVLPIKGKPKCVICDR